MIAGLVLLLLPHLAPATRAEPRIEHFLLEVEGRPEPTGLLLLRRTQRAGGLVLECESVFPRGGTAGGVHRVAHVEHLAGTNPRLVWREWGTGGSRALLAEWHDEGRELRTREWMPGEPRFETVSAGEGAVLPLYLLDLARRGRAVSGSYRRFDPLARALETVILETSYRMDEAGDVLRRVDLRRSDGTLATSAEFRGAELVSLRWQEGGPRARRVSEQEHEAALARANGAAVAVFELGKGALPVLRSP